MTTYPTIKMLIGSEWVESGDDGSMAIINPANEQEIGRAPKVSKEQLNTALAAAGNAFTVWSKTPAIERYRVIRNAADLLRERTQTIARVMTLEMGKPHVQAVGETAGAADLIDFLAEEAKRQGGRLVPVRSHNLLEQRVTHEPVGPLAPPKTPKKDP